MRKLIKLLSWSLKSNQDDLPHEVPHLPLGEPNLPSKRQPNEATRPTFRVGNRVTSSDFQKAIDLSG